MSPDRDESTLADTPTAGSPGGSTGASEPGKLTPLVPLSEASGLCGGEGQLSCAEANDLIQTYLDSAVDPESGEKLTEHLGDCPPCESEFVVYQKIVDALGRCREELPADNAARLQS
ncbi:hypothetical protein BH10ACT3_BH10ACT3_12410 [soil metagenome]